MENDTAGDPITGIKWTRKTTYKVSAALRRQRFQVCPRTASRLLKQLGFSLKGNLKTEAGQRHPDRDQQFRRIYIKTQHYRKQGVPVISVDTKKKELIGDFFQQGKTWRQDALAVSDHDFSSTGVGKAVPYGIYDIAMNQGMVVIGTSVETARFGVDAIVKWVSSYGIKGYPEAREILILCDNGGCNGSRNRLWKYELQQKICNRFGFKVTVAHYPPGASKWNPIEHRLFSFISKNMAGQPMHNFETVMKYIRTTRTQGGLRVTTTMIKRKYQKGVKVTDDAMRSVKIRRARILSHWNYTLSPN